MMYSQQEYEMFRRQMMQIEAEKRAVLRYALVLVTMLFAGSLGLLGWIYAGFSTAEKRVITANQKTAERESELSLVRDELREKTLLLNKDSSARAEVDATINRLVPRVVSGDAGDAELGELAHAVFQRPGHVIPLPSRAPDIIHQGKYRIRIQNRPYSYMLIIGLLDGRWVLYSNLVKNQEDPRGASTTSN